MKFYFKGLGIINRKSILEELLILINKKVDYKIILNELFIVFLYKKNDDIINELVYVLENKNIDRYKREEVGRILAIYEQNNNIQLKNKLLKFIQDRTINRFVIEDIVKALYYPHKNFIINEYDIDVIKEFIQSEKLKNKSFKHMSLYIIENLLEIKKYNFINDKNNNNFWEIFFLFIESEFICHDNKLKVISLLENIELDNIFETKALDIIKKNNINYKVKEKIIYLSMNKKSLKINFLRTLI